MLRKSVSVPVVIALVLMANPEPSTATVETFKGIPAGTIISGELPQGGSDDGSSWFANIISIDVHNNNGPHAAIIFDSSNPSVPDDFDLGTPNESCGGPGIGAGGEVGQPGENCIPYGNLIIIAENLVDDDKDNIVDAPDDDYDGGWIRFQFREGISAASVVLVDVDGEMASAEVTNGVLTINLAASDYGENSIQTLELGGIGVFEFLEINFSSSGGIAQINYNFPVSVEENSWGSVKARYR